MKNVLGLIKSRFIRKAYSNIITMIKYLDE